MKSLVALRLRPTYRGRPWWIFPATYSSFFVFFVTLHSYRYCSLTPVPLRTSCPGPKNPLTHAQWKWIIMNSSKRTAHKIPERTPNVWWVLIHYRYRIMGMKCVERKTGIVTTNSIHFTENNWELVVTIPFQQHFRSTRSFFLLPPLVNVW